MKRGDFAEPDESISPAPAEWNLIRELLPEIREGYRLRWKGIHGASHWARVLWNGLRVCQITGADPRIVSLFSVFHDSRRVNDWSDPPHGKRGGALAKKLLQGRPGWDGSSLDRLVEACRDHTHVRHHPDVTIQTCWDADRLDLPRVGAEVDPLYLGSWACEEGDLIREASIRAWERCFPFRSLFEEG